MSHRSIVCALASAAGLAGSAAHGQVFTWTGGDDQWSNANNGSGPVGQFPDSTVHTATLSGNGSIAQLSENISLGLLNVLNGANIFQAGHGLFVNGDVQIIGAGSFVSVQDSPLINDFDADDVLITSGLLVLNGARAQADSSVTINGTGGVLGVGILEMNGAGNLDLDDGVLWSVVNADSVGDTLRVRRTASSTARLDWTSPDASVLAWDNANILIELPYTGSLGGTITLGSNATLTSQSPIVVGPNGVVPLGGGASDLTKTVVSAPAFDIAGTLRAGRRSMIDAPFVAIRGGVELDPEAILDFPDSFVTFDSATVEMAEDIGSAQIRFPDFADGNIRFTGGATVIDLGPDGHFDLDGNGFGGTTVTVEAGSSALIIAKAVEESELLNQDVWATIIVEGELEIDVSGEWVNDGEIVMASGTLTSPFKNRGVLRGRGSVVGVIENNGEIIAEGGTLTFTQLDLDGSVNNLSAVIRAQDGDLLSTEGGGNVFQGSMFIGNGIGVREVVQTPSLFQLAGTPGNRGSLEMHSGELLVDNLVLGGDFSSAGTSALRVFNDVLDYEISFTDAASATVDGVLEFDGDAFFAAGAQYSGAGTVRGFGGGATDAFRVAPGADLSAWSFEAASVFDMGNQVNQLPSGTALLGGLTLAETAAMQFDITGAQPEESDRFVITGEATLGGTLLVTYTGEGPTAVGVEYIAITAGSITGGFSEIVEQLGANRRAYVTVDPTEVLVFVTCQGDLNADGTVNFADITAFITAFNAQLPAADVNQDGVINFADTTLLIQLFNEGCA